MDSGESSSGVRSEGIRSFSASGARIARTWVPLTWVVRTWVTWTCAPRTWIAGTGRVMTARRCRLWMRLHVTVFLQFVLPVGHHYIVDCNSAVNLSDIALRHSNVYRSYCHRLIRLHQIDKTTLRSALHGGSRNHDGVLFCFQQQVDIHKLIGPEFVPLVVEDGLQASGPGGLVNLIVNGQQLSARQLGLIITAIGIHRQCRFLHALRHGLPLVLGQGKDYGDRFELRNEQ